jgi:hypothetical protein
MALAPGQGPLSGRWRDRAPARAGLRRDAAERDRRNPGPSVRPSASLADVAPVSDARSDASPRPGGSRLRGARVTPRSDALPTRVAPASSPPAARARATRPTRRPGPAPSSILLSEALAPPGRLWLRPFTHSRAPAWRSGRGAFLARDARRPPAAGEALPQRCPHRRDSSARCARRRRSPARRTAGPHGIRR